MAVYVRTMRGPSPRITYIITDITPGPSAAHYHRDYLCHNYPQSPTTPRSNPLFIFR